MEVRVGDFCQHMVGISLVVLWLSDMSSAFSLSEPALYSLCAVSVAVFIVVTVVLIIICCRRSKRLKKKKGAYHHVREPSTLQSLYRSSKPTPEAFTTNKKVPISATSSNSKAGRPRSDTLDQRRYVVPEWRRQQDMKNGSYVTGVHRSPSDVSVPSGIWTSNPTLTRGMHSSFVAMPLVRNEMRPQTGISSSVPSLYETPTSLYANLPVKDKQKSSKLYQQAKNDLIKVEEDTKELLPASSSEDTSSDREHQVVARAYSSPVSQKDPEDGGTLTRPSSKNPYVAKVFSDYQLPKDFIRPRLQSNQEDGKVAKAFSSNVADGRQQRTTDIRRHHSSPNKLAGVHVARAVVRHSSSLDSNGEPKYARPQDALDVVRSDPVSAAPGGRLAGRIVGRSQSGREKTAPYQAAGVQKNRRSRRPSSQVLGKRGSFNVSGSSTEISATIPDASGNVIFRASGDGQQLRSSKTWKEHVGRMMKRSASSADKQKAKDTKSGTKNVNSLVLDIGAADRINIDSLSAEGGYVGPLEMLVGETSSPEPISADSGLTSVIGPISESSSIPAVTELDCAPPNEEESEAAVLEEDLNPIYSLPIKRDRTERIVEEERTAEEESPSTPKTPPTPPITELRAEPLSPKPPPLPPVIKLREEPLTPASSVTPPSETETTSASSHAQLADELTPASSATQPADGSPSPVPSKAPAEATPNQCPASLVTTDEQNSMTPLPSPLCLIKNRDINDGDCISTGKNVVRDAFRFLEDFDDLSLDAEDRL